MNNNHNIVSLVRPVQMFYSSLANDMNHYARKTVFGVESSTGSGKSTGIIRLAKNQHDVFGSTLVVEPTTSACQALQKKTGCFHDTSIHIVHVQKAIDILLEKNVYSTIVVDEAHIMSRDYMFLWRILRCIARRQSRCRIFFMSACLPFTELSGFFPLMVHLVYRFPTRFPISITYESENIMSWSPFTQVCLRKVLKAAFFRIHEAFENGNKKILIFLATRNDCESLADDLGVWCKENKIAVHVLHGGLEMSEKQNVYNTWSHDESFVLISTNIIESSVTIPDLDVVIDSGLECRLIGSFFQTVYATKRSFIQRTGRVGRTKPGSVYRLLHETEYQQEIQDFVPVQYDMTAIMFKLFNRRHRLTDYFDNDSVNAFLKTLSDHNISSLTPSVKTHFLEQSGFSSVDHGLLAYSIPWERHMFGCFLFLILHAMEFYSEKMPQWVYVRKGQSRCAAYTKIGNEFDIENDAVLSLVHILVHVFQDKKEWKKRAKSFSLSIHTLREFITSFRRSLQRIRPQCDIDMFFKKGVKYLPRLKNDIRWFFFRNRYTPFHPVRTDPRLCPYFIEYTNTIWYVGYDSKICSSQRFTVLPLCVVNSTMSLWINLPIDIESHIAKIEHTTQKRHIMMEHREELLCLNSLFGEFWRSELILQSFDGDMLTVLESRRQTTHSIHFSHFGYERKSEIPTIDEVITDFIEVCRYKCDVSRLFETNTRLPGDVLDVVMEYVFQ